MQRSGTNDVHDRARPDLLEVLDERSRVASVGGGTVDALGRVVVELFEVGVHDNFLLVCVLERFAALDRSRQDRVEVVRISIVRLWSIRTSSN